MGALGSQVFIGTTVGGVVAGFAYQRTNAKAVQCLMLVLGSLDLASFPLSSNLALVFASRFLTGVCQAFLTVYYTVWVDLFAPKSLSTLWITLLQLMVPAGMLAGYVLTASMRDQWYYSCYIQAVLYLPCLLMLLLFPGRLVTRNRKTKTLLETEALLEPKPLPSICRSVKLLYQTRCTCAVSCV